MCPSLQSSVRLFHDVGKFFAAALSLLAGAAAAQPRPLCIHVESGDAGLDGVRLTTTGHLVVTTDVNGNAAFYEPGLMGKEVFFTVTRPGYAHAKDFFGY